MELATLSNCGEVYKYIILTIKIKLNRAFGKTNDMVLNTFKKLKIFIIKNAYNFKSIKRIYF